MLISLGKIQVATVDSTFPEQHPPENIDVSSQAIPICATYMIPSASFPDSRTHQPLFAASYGSIVSNGGRAAAANFWHNTGDSGSGGEAMSNVHFSHGGSNHINNVEYSHSQRPSASFCQEFEPQLTTDAASYYDRRDEDQPQYYSYASDYPGNPQFFGQHLFPVTFCSYSTEPGCVLPQQSSSDQLPRTFAPPPCINEGFAVFEGESKSIPSNLPNSDRNEENRADLSVKYNRL